MSAALSPAGPPPTTTTSNIGQRPRLQDGHQFRCLQRADRMFGWGTCVSGCATAHGTAESLSVSGDSWRRVRSRCPVIAQALLSFRVRRAETSAPKSLEHKRLASFADTVQPLAEDLLIRSP